MNVAVVGTGYVGLVTGVVLASLGHVVTCVDVDPAKLEILRSGKPTIYEPGLDKLMAKGLADGKLHFTADIAEAMAEAEIVFIAVGTPPAADGDVDLRYVRSAATDIAKAIHRSVVVVNKSTVPVGTAELVADILRGAGVSEEMFDVVSNPEFLREGSAIEDAIRPDRIIIGADRPEAADKLVKLYAALGGLIIRTDPRSAELAKYAANTFLAMKISYINAISRLCEACGADVGDVAKGMGTDPRIGNLYLQAGLGWGGSCFPKDVLGLQHIAAKHGYRFGLVDETVRVNDEQTPHFMDRLGRELGGFEGKTVALIGLAFKPNTDDIRDARSLLMIRRLEREGATIRACDPEAVAAVRKLHPDVTYVRDAYEAVDGADAVVLVTEWPEYRQLDLAALRKRMRGDLFFDGRRVVDRDGAENAGFRLVTVGR